MSAKIVWIWLSYLIKPNYYCHGLNKSGAKYIMQATFSVEWMIDYPGPFNPTPIIVRPPHPPVTDDPPPPPPPRPTKNDILQ